MIARAKFPLEVTLLACCSAVGSPAEALTERQVLQRFRESPYHRELEAGIRVVREGNRRHSLYPNPNISATFEGAGRTDFFMVEQPIVVNGRRNLLSQAGDSAVKVAQTSAAHTLRQVESQLRQSFYQLVYAQGRQRLIREGQSELEGIARILREREIAGEGSRFDRLRAELEIANLESEAVETETLVTTSRAKLAGFLGDLVVSDTLRAIGDMDAAYGLPALGEAFADALSARSDYKLETQRLEQLRLEGEAAKRLRIPNPVVSGGVKRAEVGGQFFNGPVLAFGIDVPLFSKGQVDRALAEAKAEKARARRRILESQILADVRAAHDSLRIRRQNARDYRLQVGNRTRDLLEIAQVAYEEGELGILELLDAVSGGRRTKLRQWELEAAAKMAEIDFDRSVARELLP